MPTDTVVVVISCQAQPGKSDLVRKEFSALIRAVLASEPACLGIWFHQNLDDETKFLMYERWTDRTAYVGPHMQTSHMQAFVQKAPNMFAGTPTITFWRLNA
jgi:quinol monooxygenase YgiN